MTKEPSDTSKESNNMPKEPCNAVNVYNRAVYIYDSRLLQSRFTSRPEARGSGVEAVFRFLGSGVDFF